MSGIACVLLLTTALAGQPLSIEVDRGAEALVVKFKLAGELPQSVESTLDSGLATEIDYTFRVYGRRRMFPDRKIWKGVAKASATFDAVTGRYRCQVIVNGTTTISREVDTAEAARVLAGPRARSLFQRHLLADPPVNRGYGLDRGATRSATGRHMSSNLHGSWEITR